MQLWSFSIEEKEESNSTRAHTTWPTHTTHFLCYIHSSWLSKGPVVWSVLTQWKGLYCCLFPSNGIFQWQFDYPPLWRKKEQFEDRLTFSSLYNCSLCFFIHCILTIPSALCSSLQISVVLREVYHKHSQSARNKKERDMCVCVFFCICVASLFWPWMGFAVDILDL